MKRIIRELCPVMTALCMVLIMVSCGSDKQVVDKEMTISFAGVNATVSLYDLTYERVDFRGDVNFSEAYTAESFGVVCSRDSIPNRHGTIPIKNVYDTEYSVSSGILAPSTKYYYALYVQCGRVYKFSDVKSFVTEPHPYTIRQTLDSDTAVDLSSDGTANCYMISECGLYKIKAVKGNSSEPVGDVASAEILWEESGRNNILKVFDLLSAVCYKDGHIIFQTSEVFKPGNALIAAKDEVGNILWSWHIWLTEQINEHKYYNGAGTVMDRNLGAQTQYSNHIFYQWGRKDPLPNESYSQTSIYFWPSGVKSDQFNGTIEYAISHPMTRISANDNNGDWYYSEDDKTDNTRWSTSEEPKTIYDPCPFGWRVPDGGPAGLWAKALGSSKPRQINSTFEDDEDVMELYYSGVDFSDDFGNYPRIWYPFSNYMGGGAYWSASPKGNLAYSLKVELGYVVPSFYEHNSRAKVCSIRCVKE